MELLGISGYDIIDDAAISGGDILDIIGILKTPLDLERRDSGEDHLLDMLRGVEIAQREEITVAHQDLPPTISEGIRETTHLRALTAIGRTAHSHAAGAASTGIADTESAMDETLYRHRHFLRHLSNLLDRELTRQDNLRKTDILKETGLLRRTSVALRAGMQSDGWDIESQK